MMRWTQLGDVAPSGYAFGNAATYWASAVQALGALAPSAVAPPGAPTDILNPPMRTHVAALIAVAESVSDLPLGQLVALAGNVASLAQASDPYVAMEATLKLLDASLDVASSVAEAVGAAGSMAQVVPIIGTVIDSALAGLSIGMAYKAAQEQATAQCARAIACYATKECTRLVGAARPTPTRSTLSGGVTAADLFRPVRYAVTDPHLAPFWRERLGGSNPLPFTVASVYVALCGDAVPSGTVAARWVWQSLKDKPGSPAGHFDGRPGIPLATRRRMWALCRAILEAAEPPPRPGQAFPPPIAADGANTLFAPLQDIVHRELERGRISERYVRRVCELIGDQIKYKSTWLTTDNVFKVGCGDFASGVSPGGGCKLVSSSSAGSAAYFEQSCREVVAAGLFDAWLSGWTEYNNRLREQFFDYATNSWRERPAWPMTKIHTAALTLRPQAAKMLAKAVSASRQPSAQKRAVVGTSVATILGAATALAATLL